MFQIRFVSPVRTEARSPSAPLLSWSEKLTTSVTLLRNGVRVEYPFLLFLG